MGRHSASRTGARGGLPAKVTAAGAAKFVGRVGAMAFTLGVGAAIAGGAVANAEGATDHRTNGGADAKSSTPKVAHRGPADSVDGPSAVKTRTPRLVNALKTRAVTDPGAPPRIRAASKGANRPDGLPPLRSVTARERTVDSFVRAKVDEVAAALREERARGVAPRRTTDAVEQQSIPVRPLIAPVVSGVASGFGFSPSPSAGDSPVAPTPVVLVALQLLRREIDHVGMHHLPSTAAFVAAENDANANPATTLETPTRDDQVPTDYGNIGKWMLESNGDVSDYGGQPYNGKVLLEPVNVIIVDPKAKNPEQAKRRLNTAMFWAGFPAQPIHSTGFQGSIDDMTYGQQPTGILSGYSNNLFILPNDHGRIFGPDPVETDGGYVWSGTFSTEQFGIYQLLPAHTYVSSDLARTALAMRLILSGQATFVGMVPLDNAYNTESTTTGDHDGYAVVLQLR